MEIRTGNWQVAKLLGFLIIFHFQPSAVPAVAAENTPEIQFVNIYPSTEYADDQFVVKNGSDYAIQEDASAITFSCKAAYPINWTFPILSQWTEVHVATAVSTDEFRQSELKEGSAEPTNAEFLIYITFGRTSQIKFVRTELTCGSIENTPAVRSTIYLSLSGNRGVENKNDANDSESFQSKSIISGKASFQVGSFRTADLEEDITCCSGVDQKPPTLDIRGCSTVEHCALLKQTILKNTGSAIIPARSSGKNVSSDCANGVLEGSMNIVVCKGENVDVMEHLVNMLHPVAGGPVVERSNRISASQDNKTPPIPVFKYETISVAEAAPTTRKVIMLLTKPVTESPKDVKSRPLQFRTVYKTQGKLGAAKGEPLISEEYDRDHYFVGETFRIVCVGSKQFYSNGGIMRVNFANGTGTIVSRSYSADNQEKYGNVQHRVYLAGDAQLTNEFGYTIVVSDVEQPLEVSSEMASVECHMPLENSSKWETLTKKLVVKPAP